MTLTHKFSVPLLLTTAAGLTGAAMRLLLYRTGFDEKGILSARHPLHLATMILAVCLVLWLVLELRTRTDQYTHHPRLSLACGFAGCILLLFGTVATEAPQAGTLHAIRLILSGAAALCMPLALWLNPRHPKAAFWCHCLICISFGVDMLCRYQTWSGNPQLPDYCFHVLACVFLTLSTYHRLAFGAQIGKLPALHFTCLTALLLCMMSTVGPDPWQFYLAGACWALSNFLAPIPPEQPKQEEVRNDVSA